jgi:ComF family protein
MRLFSEKLFQFFLPSQCLCCGKFLGVKPQGICSDCFREIHWIDPPFCTVCGVPFVSKETGNHPCGACRSKSRYFTIARALGYYEGPLQEAIHRWKYQGKISLTPLFGNWMAQGVKRFWSLHSFDLLIPVPLHIGRLRERGFNQAVLLARDLSWRTGIPLEKRLLRKLKPTVPQVSLSGVEREKGIRGVFQIVDRNSLDGKSVLLVDDVYTTGATVNECAKVLLAAGAKQIDVLTLSHAVQKI